MLKFRNIGLSTFDHFKFGTPPISNIRIKFFIFQIRNFRSNVERLGFRNLKITNIKITNDELSHFFIYEFVFLFLKKKLENLRNLLFFYLGNDKVSEI